MVISRHQFDEFKIFHEIIVIIGESIEPLFVVIVLWMIVLLALSG